MWLWSRIVYGHQIVHPTTSCSNAIPLLCEKALTYKMQLLYCSIRQDTSVSKMSFCMLIKFYCFGDPAQFLGLLIHWYLPFYFGRTSISLNCSFCCTRAVCRKYLEEAWYRLSSLKIGKKGKIWLWLEELSFIEWCAGKGCVVGLCECLLLLSSVRCVPMMMRVWIFEFLLPSLAII